MSLILKNIPKIKLSQFKNFTMFRPNRLIGTTTNCKNAKLDSENEDKPIPYLGSNAEKWKAEQWRRSYSSEAPWYQFYVIIGSVSVFMIYFFILREENDIDLEFDKTLYDRISGLEEAQLKIALEYNKDHQKPTAEIENKLKEIQTKQESK